jgi:hypothetical protein
MAYEEAEMDGQIQIPGATGTRSATVCRLLLLCEATFDRKGAPIRLDESGEQIHKWSQKTLLQRGLELPGPRGYPQAFLVSIIPDDYEAPSSRPRLWRIIEEPVSQDFDMVL